MNKNRSVIIIIFLIILVLSTIVIAFIRNIDSKETSEEIIVNISVFNKENSNIYNEKISTSKKYLIDVLNDVKELQVKTEESDYGAYITSVLGIQQGEDYYWSYYINDEYATTGVTNCELKDGNTYSLKIEKLEY